MPDSGGRRPRQTSERGRRRRQAIVEAAGELVMSQGFAAVGHRAVAARAGVPLAATTYYFSSLDALLESAAGHLAEQWMQAARAALDELPEAVDASRLARALIDVVALSPGGASDIGDTAALGLYDRYLEAARRPGLQAVVAGYDAVIEELISTTLRRGGADPEPHDARLVLAVIDGALLRCYAEGLPVDEAVECLDDLLRLIAARRDP